MVMTTETQSTRFEPIDPYADSTIEDVQVAIPDVRGSDLHRAVFNYDRPSDILLFYPYGKERPAVAAGGADNVYVLIDPDSEEFLGIQIDDFLSRAVKDRPSWFDVLDVAELQGMTIADVRDARQHALGYRGRFRTWLARLGCEAPWRRTSAKQRAISEIIDRTRSNLAVCNGPSLSVT